MNITHVDETIRGIFHSWHILIKRAYVARDGIQYSKTFNGPQDYLRDTDGRGAGKDCRPPPH